MTRPKNSDIKSDRVRSFFVEAAKAIILRDGVDGASVRKVAALAGYSYATMYNYFLDLNQLLQETKHAMILDLVEHMGKVENPSLQGAEAIRYLNRKYALYFLDHPHVYRFFYSCQWEHDKEAAKPHFDYESSWQECYQRLVDDGVIRREDIMIVARTVIYAVHGLLALYFSNNGITREMLFSELDDATDYIVGGKKEV
ncbi:MAG: TetR/AcrR family transcriptional regulator [Firmicutes bacterium]|nr:TetR/AcrR family transcriptional regulator [Bacillota bacterium]